MLPPDAAIALHQTGSLREGDSFNTAGRTITEADIVSFARLSGDLHPLHLDEEWAASSQFGGRIAPGALVLAYSLGLLKLDPDRAVAMRGITDVLFLRPVRIGDTISVSARVTSPGECDSATSPLELTLTTLNQDGKRVCRARAQVLWKSDPSARDPSTSESSGGGER